MVQQEAKRRVYWKLALLLLAAISVLLVLLGSVGAISDCNDVTTPGSGLLPLWSPACRAGTGPVPTSVFFLPPLIVLLVVVAWRKLKRGSG
ncbi:MAG: hypothetical protein H6875_14225 [Hyphomicrobiaceae bacterium]|nr:hypothetical protein [Hyphomicrobiaceae bacterium]